MAPPRTSPRGVFWSLTSAFLWATTFVTVKPLLSEGRVDPITLSLLRFSLGGAALLALGLLTRRPGLLSISRRDFLDLLVLGFFGMLGMSALLFWGQQTTTAVNASMIMQTSPLLILLGGLFIGQKIGKIQALGMLTSLTGCLLVVEVLTPRGFRFQGGHLGGDLLVLGGASCWAIYSLLGKPVVARLGGFKTTTWAMIFGAGLLLVLRLIAPVPFMPPGGLNGWAPVLYLAFLPTAVAFFAWYEAMNLIPLPLLNVMQYLTPAFTLFLAWFLLGEWLAPVQWAGIGLILGGVVLTGLGIGRSGQGTAAP